MWIYSSSYWEIFDIGVLCVIAVLMDKLESAKYKVEFDETKDESTEPLMIDNLMPNDSQLKENYPSEIDNYSKAGVFEAHSPSVAISEIIQTEETSSKLISFSNETLFTEETAAPSASEGNGDNKSGNKKEFLIALLDEMDFSSETANELPKEAILETASDEKAIGSELLVSTEFLESNETEIFEKQILKKDDERVFGSENMTVEAAVIAQTAENEADGEKSSAIFDEQYSLQVVPNLKKYDEETNKCQILTAKASSNHLAAEKKTAKENSTTVLHEQCYLIVTDVPIPEQYDEKTSEYRILPVVNALVGEKADGEKLPTFFDEKYSLQGVPILEIYDETTFECQILTAEPSINAPAAEDKADEEKSS
ncbi:hypothetical protein AVEN_171884-1, partial [Araneus ventricosus]